MEPDAVALLPITPATAGAPTVTLAAAAEVQRLDVAAMREKALGILASLKAQQAAITKKHVRQLLRIIFSSVEMAVLCIIRIILYYVLYYIMYCSPLPVAALRPLLLVGARARRGCAR